MNFAILGAGGIARKMADTVIPMPSVCCKAVGSRSLTKAQAFAAEYGFEKAYGSYEEMLADPEVDLVYIATPHSHHKEWTMKALEAGKHVLCEKAFAVNEAEAREMIQLAEQKGLLLTEAIWTRYMPSRKMIDEIVGSGVLGDIRTVNSNLGYQISHVPRILRPELAGGALLDLTVYPLNFSSMVFGNDIKKIDANCIKIETGMDAQETVMLTYNDDRMATMFTTIYAQTDRCGWIYGDKGYLQVDNINNPSALHLWSTETRTPTLVKTYEVPAQISGYEYEVLAAQKAIEEGKIECPEMPHAETLEIMRQMDAIRKQFGIVYPFE